MLPYPLPLPRFSFSPTPPVYRAPTRRRATDATLFVGVECRLVVNSYLFTRFDIAKRQKKNVTVEYFHERIRFA